MPKHRRQEFICFLNKIDCEMPKHHPRFHMHFTPTAASWRNPAESFFTQITQKRIRRGVFHSFVDPQLAINDDLKQHNGPERLLFFQVARLVIGRQKFHTGTSAPVQEPGALEPAPANLQERLADENAA